MKSIPILGTLLLVFPALSAQIVWTDPPFPSQEDNITLWYDAAEGNGDLEGVVPIYGHFGAITSNSSSDADWQNVVGDWGTADADVLMNFEGGSLYSFDYNGLSLEDFFSLDEGETLDCLAMVFRNATGSTVGRESDGGDIYYCLPEAAFAMQILSPQLDICEVLQPGDAQDFNILVSLEADISLLINGTEVASIAGSDNLQHSETFDEGGEYTITVEATDADGATISEEFTLIVLPEITVESPPEGVRDGINYINDNTVILQLHAPFKEYVFVAGDFSNWELDLDYFMKQVPGGQKWWVQVDGLTPQTEYRYLYLIDETCLPVADMYAEKVLDPYNDPWIPETTYPNLIDYPDIPTDAPVAVLETGQTPYAWTDGDFQRPQQENLVIYELLVRDFSEESTYKFVKDSIPYLKNLGITALELMPFNEFNGNNSWGYNPTFFFAPDKYYGTKTDLKDLINACHEAGIAVIMDVAFNHSDFPNPQLVMYWDADFGDWGAPAENNPWFNQIAPHGLTFFFDYDHSSPATKDYVKRFMEHWVEEYHIDGWRWDFTQGMTQTNTLSGGNTWDYDQFRIDLLTEYADHIWAIDPNAYMILEHWTTESEEQVLTDYGMMTWANVTHDYQEGSMGYPSNFNWANYQDHGFSQPRSVSYMQSHDEERLMYKNLEFGNSEGAYDIQNLQTALERIELSACFSIPIPGPKMIWQFEELGYDYSINYCEDGTISDDCRVAPKPVRWDYRDDASRYRVYQVMAALNKLKRDYPTFQTTDFNLDVGGTGKRIHLYHPDMHVVVVGNFDVTGFDMVPGFPETGTWYDYFSGEAIEVTDLNAGFFYEAGEYHLYTNQPLPTPDLGVGIQEESFATAGSFTVYPNPSEGEVTFELSAPVSADATLSLFDAMGRKLFDLPSLRLDAGKSVIHWDARLTNGQSLPSGTYILRADVNGVAQSTRFVRH